ncbi:unnamed protein product [Adineta steineri]|uniref:Uncharacterized protein n=2 Tax=Adineta steineri TaxID=433720 RepID=A0A819WVJ0_9BILA|nr:unnamed protein product [Adineta steineri]
MILKQSYSPLVSLFLLQHQSYKTSFLKASFQRDMHENPADFEHLLFYYWPYLFAFVDPITATTLSKVSIRNWLISSSSINSFDFELQYLIDLNRFFSNEYRVSIPL